MRFPHNAKIFRGQLDVAPFAGVFFLLVLFLLLQSGLVFTPGVPVELELPTTIDLPGVATSTVALAVDEDGVVYYRSQVMGREQLSEQLRREVIRHRQPLTLVIQADRQTRHETLVQLAVLARNAGIQRALLAVRPSVVPPAAHPVSAKPVAAQTVQNSP